MAIAKINAPGLPEKPSIYSHVTVAGGFIYVSGQLPADATGKLISGDVQEHTRQCIRNIEKALKAAGASLNDLVKVNIFLKDMGDFNAINEVYEQVSVHDRSKSTNRETPAEPRRRVSQMIPAPKPSRTCVQAGKRTSCAWLVNSTQRDLTCG